MDIPSYAHVLQRYFDDEIPLMRVSPAVSIIVLPEARDQHLDW